MAQPAPLHILITGAARGIGRGLTRLLLAKGHRVFLLDSNQAELDHTVQTHLQPRFPAAAFRASLTNLRSPPEIAAAADAAAAFFDHRLDVLINNAALTPGAGSSSGSGSGSAPRFEDLALADWTAALETNLTAPLLLSQACVPMLRREGGTIIHLSSTRARQSEPLSESYAATKAGLIGLTHAMASSLAGDGITVNAILPGWINVMNENKEADERGVRWEDGLTADEHAWHFSGRVGKVEVGPLFFPSPFVLSSCSSLLLGSTLLSDGNKKWELTQICPAGRAWHGGVFGPREVCQRRGDCAGWGRDAQDGVS